MIALRLLHWADKYGKAEHNAQGLVLVRRARRGATKRKLFLRYRHHINETHQDTCLTDEQIHTVITANAYEVALTVDGNEGTKGTS